LTPTEEKLFHEALAEVVPALRECGRVGDQFGIVEADMMARISIRKDGTITAVGFNFTPHSDSAKSFVGCVRGALAGMKLRHIPWEADRRKRVLLHM
jgi:hypothetical protein